MSARADGPLRRWTTLVLGVITILLGAVFALGGAELISLGGSAYYLPAGIGLLVCGGIYLRRRQSGLRIYALILMGTVLWAWWESINGRWMMARVFAPLVLGILLTLPAIGAPADCARGIVGSRKPYLVAAGMLVLLVLFAVTRPVLAPASNGLAPDYLQADGDASRDVVSTVHALATPEDYGNEDWLHYAGGLKGNGFSTLTQITACGHSALSTRLSDAVVAYALPRD
jgi:quinoprotein glucose dehydrogenase